MPSKKIVRKKGVRRRGNQKGRGNVRVIHVLPAAIAILLVAAVLSFPLITQSTRSAGSDADADRNIVEIVISNGTYQGDFFEPGPEFRKQNVLRVEGNVLAVGIDCTAIVAATSPERAEAIQAGLEGTIPDRPASYDGWAAMLERFGIRFEALAMHAMTEEAYLARGYFTFGEHVLDLDMKPSDGMALALRTKTPIYINTTLLQEQGQDIC